MSVTSMVKKKKKSVSATDEKSPPKILGLRGDESVSWLWKYKHLVNI